MRAALVLRKDGCHGRLEINNFNPRAVRPELRTTRSRGRSPRRGYGLARSAARIRSMQRSMSVESWCSQNRKTRTPDFLRAVETLRSRKRFRRIFVRQKALFARGKWPQRRQPCQKQPSTKTASFDWAKKKSGLPGNPLTPTFQPLIPARTNASRKAASVDLFPEPRTALIFREMDCVTPLNPPFRSLRRSIRSIECQIPSS
jgi:hypothetical protein